MPVFRFGTLTRQFSHWCERVEAGVNREPLVLRDRQRSARVEDRLATVFVGVHASQAQLVASFEILRLDTALLLLSEVFVQEIRAFCAVARLRAHLKMVGVAVDVHPSFVGQIASIDDLNGLIDAAGQLDVVVQRRVRR